MLYVPTDYEDYKYIVSVSDNYVVLTNRSHVSGSYQQPNQYPIIYKYLNPSDLTITGVRTATTDNYFNEIEISDDFWDRADCSNISLCVFFVVLILISVINSLTEFVQKGGIFKL